MRIGFLIIGGILLLCALTAGVCAQPSNRVVLVIIDGARYTETLGDPTGTITPRMKLLASTGTVVDTFVNDNITVTARAIPAIWTGSWAAPIDTTIPPQAKNQYCATPTVWEYFRKSHGVDSTQAIYFTKYLTTPWMPSFTPSYGPAFWPWYLSAGATDRDVWKNGLTVMGLHHPQLAVMYLADVDHEGHSGVQANYLRALSIADSIVSEVWDFLQSDPVYAGCTTLFVTNDHGRHDDQHGGFKGHGDGCWGCRHIMMLSVGPGVRMGFRSTVRRAIPDIVPTIGQLLDFPTPLSTGTVMSEIFPPTSIGSEAGLPATVRLEQNYPNPFNPATEIRYTVAAPSPELAEGSRGQTSQSPVVSLKVYDLMGREVAALVNEAKSPGVHTVTWNAAGQSAGVYFCRLTVGRFCLTRKLVLLK
jgi:hypothetical protein